MAAGFVHTLSISAVDVERLYGKMLEARATFLAAGAKAQADEVALVLRQLDTDFRRISREVSALATTRVREHIKATAKRPAGGIASGDLMGHIVCTPIPSTPSIAGVGIGLLDELNKVRNPNRTSRKPYWRAQEYGLDAGFVGRELRGFFRDPGGGGAYKPDPADFRVHPIFSVTSKGGKARIKNPIEPRHFLRDGKQDAEVAFTSKVQQAEHRMASSLAPLIAGSRALVPPKHPGIRPARRRLP